MTGTWQPPLIAPPGSVHQADPDVIRLLIFNTQHASPARARRQVAWIAGQRNADLVILTEVGAGPGGHALTSTLAEHGYQSVLAPEPSPPDYRTVIASRGPDLTAVPAGIPILGHRAPAAVVSYAGQQIGLLGLYVPSRGPRERRNQAKRAFQDAVTSALPGFTARFDAPVIVAGDLNVIEPGHIPHHAVFGEWEYDFYRSFAAAGLADAYRLLHSDEAAHSWYGRSGEGYRFDHAFITASHRAHVRDCRYLHEPRQQGLTDHAAMILAITVAEPLVSQVFDSLVATPPPAEMRPVTAQNEANPLEPKNLLDCQAKVRETGADIGLAFDGDADRCFFIDERGEPVPPSAIVGLVAARELARHPGSAIVHNVITSAAATEIIREHGGTPVRSRVGHSYMKALMASHDAVFGGEHSGHYYFRDFWRADTGMLTALHVLAALGGQDQPLSELTGDYTRYVASGEINSHVDDVPAKLDEVEAAHTRPGVSTDRLDGLTVNLGDGCWFNLRPSNTEPLLRLNVEAPTQDAMSVIRDEVLALVRR